MPRRPWATSFSGFAIRDSADTNYNEQTVKAGQAKIMKTKRNLIQINLLGVVLLHAATSGAQTRFNRLWLGLCSAILICLACNTQGAPVIWADWTSAQVGNPSGSVTGVLTFGAVTVNVTYAGEVFNTTQLNGTGTDYYTPTTTYTTAVVTNPPLTGMVTFVGSSTVDTISFSPAVSNPIMAIMSEGSPGVNVDFTFDAPFQILSTGPGWWGGGPALTQTGNTLHGAESDGLIQFNGTFSAISWTVSPGDTYYNGITVGAAALGSPTLNIQFNNDTGGNNAYVILSWNASGFSLQSATMVNGQYTTVSGATSPYTNAITGSQMYFRLQAN